MSGLVAMMSEPPTGRILVLDDEAEIRNMLQRFLTGQGFEVRTVRDSVQLDAQLERQPYDLLLLDVMMPGDDGLLICRRLRAQGQNIPILMLTARGDPIDRVIGLEMGADDYLAKPFVPSELTARVRAILRRQQILGYRQGTRFGTWPESGSVALRFGPYVLKPGRAELSVDGKAVDVGMAEMRLLCALAETPNRPVSRVNLLERTRGHHVAASERSIDVQVLRLRQIIEADASAPRYVRTLWGIGYMLMADYVR